MDETPLILAIDPGEIKSGWVIVTATSATLTRPRLLDCGINANAWMVDRIQKGQFNAATHFLIEKFMPRGNRIGADSLETIHWSGRMYQTILDARTIVPYRISRDIIKRHLCGSSAVKDKHIRQAIINRYKLGSPDPVGLPSSPGPLYDLTEHAWAAMAVALTFLDTEYRHGTR